MHKHNNIIILLSYIQDQSTSRITCTFGSPFKECRNCSCHFLWFQTFKPVNTPRDETFQLVAFIERVSDVHAVGEHQVEGDVPQETIVRVLF